MLSEREERRAGQRQAAAGDTAGLSSAAGAGDALGAIMFLCAQYDHPQVRGGGGGGLQPREGRSRDSGVVHQRQSGWLRHGIHRPTQKASVSAACVLLEHCITYSWCGC